jgi:hypothetical protein
MSYNIALDPFQKKPNMALKGTIYKAQLQLTDMDRNVYADHNVSARHRQDVTDA